LPPLKFVFKFPILSPAFALIPASNTRLALHHKVCRCQGRVNRHDGAPACLDAWLPIAGVVGDISGLGAREGGGGVMDLWEMRSRLSPLDPSSVFIISRDCPHVVLVIVYSIASTFYCISLLVTRFNHPHERMRMARMRTSALLCGALFGVSATAGGLSVDTRDNILKSASAVAGDLVALSKDGAYPDSPGRLSNYSYWEGAQVMSSLIDYWHKTNDSTFNDMARDAITFQAAEDTFMPANLRPSYLANEDQCRWGLAAMLAAEDRFPEPSKDGQQWVSIAQDVYDMQKARIDEDKWCDGGLRWAIDASHHGWGTKNGTL